MKFSEGLIQTYKTKWSFINSFRVQFVFNQFIKQEIDWDDDTDGRNINLNIISIDTPQFTNDPIEIFQANRWKIGNGRDLLYRFTITFRDQDQMKYYKKFLKLYQFTKEDYFDTVKFDLLLFKDADYYYQDESFLLSLNDSIIESVSQLQFNNTTENQIAEFSVNFKCTKPISL